MIANHMPMWCNHSTVLRRDALIFLVCGALALVLCTRPASGRDEAGCVWGPIKDLEAVQALLRTWAASENLPAYDTHKWELGIDGGSTRLMLPFAPGTLTFTWKLDDDCEPAAITITASPDYEGKRPDRAAV